MLFDIGFIYVRESSRNYESSDVSCLRAPGVLHREFTNHDLLRFWHNLFDAQG